MRRLIIATSILISFTANAWCQQDGFAEKLLAAEKLIFEARDSTAKNLLIVEKIKVYTAADSLGEKVLQEVLRVNPEALPDSARAAFYWNAAILSYLNQEMYKPVNYISDYESLTVDSSLNFKILKFMAYRVHDTAVARQVYIELVEADSMLACLQCISMAENAQSKHRNLKLNASLIVPGSGMMLTGNVGKGVISLALNAATVFAVVYLVKYRLFINAVGWGTNLFGKFYAGNVRLTEKSVLEQEKQIKNKLALSCELKIGGVFNKCPLNFK